MKKCKMMAVLLAAAALSGCGGYESLLNQNDPVSITIWHYYNGVQQTQFDELVNEFNNTVGSEKGIFVEAFSKNSISELANSVISAVNGEPGADEPPNIFGTYVETAFQLDQMGKLADLSPYISEEEKAEYVEDYINEGTFNGQNSFMIFPTAKSTEVLMLNLTDWKDFAAAENVSYDDLSTWEGLARTAEKYYYYTDALTPDVPDDGKAFFGRDSVANYMFIGAKQLGCAFAETDEAGSVTVKADRETMRKLWDNFYVPYVKGYYTSKNRFRSEDAKTGSIIALVCSTTGATYYPSEVTIQDEYTYPIENMVLNVPNFEGTDPYIVQQGAGMAVVRSDEKTEYACSVFLKWFTEEERNIQFSVRSGYLPVKRSANDFDKISAANTDGAISPTMLNTLKTAIDEVNSYSLYTSPPYEKSAQVRDFIGDTMEQSAKDARAAVLARIADGEARDAVLEEYTGDSAFSAWFESFESGLYAAAGQ